MGEAIRDAGGSNLIDVSKSSAPVTGTRSDSVPIYFDLSTTVSRNTDPISIGIIVNTISLALSNLQ